MKILVLEPYCGGSHQTFLAGLQARVPHDFTLLSLPARKWKWRMRLAAPYFAEHVRRRCIDGNFDAVLCSSFVDVATLRSLLPHAIDNLPFFTYFHENQFAYPVRTEDERDFHFGLTNLTTVLASDRVAFNTEHNLRTFRQGVEDILKICPDMKLAGITAEIEKKSAVIHPGIDFSYIDQAVQQCEKQAGPPVIVWNHRWEHDKNPNYFFETLYELDRKECDFRLIVLGQSFTRRPKIFDEAREKLRSRVMHFGYAQSRQEYARLLCQGDIVVSTARHEFYGMAVIEAVRAGCIPVLPDRLSYPELFPAKYLYKKDGLFSRLQTLLAERTGLEPDTAGSLTEGFSWSQLGNTYKEWLAAVKV
jgi:glycosyltransferase involved in cell wall biosynthesis